MKALAFILALAVLAPATAWAGPPFITDDPETVEYQHGEFYIASQYANNKDSKEGTAPHFEFNYGIIPDVQLHLLVPLAFVHPNGGPTMYGFGDTEVGVKYRFLHETDSVPQVGTFPIVHLPTGDSDRAVVAMCRCSSRSGSRKVGGHGRRTVVAATGSIQVRETRTSGS